MEIQIMTSYFGQNKNLLNAGILPIGIARYSPRWLSGLKHYKALAPPPELIKTPPAEYVPVFVEQLKKLEAKKVVEDIFLMVQEAGVRKVALCCYEKPADFCHRHLVGEWLYHTGAVPERVKEFGTDSVKVRLAQWGHYGFEAPEIVWDDAK